MTSADSQTQAMPDGTLATTTTVMPTRMQDASGNWEDIDPTLEMNSNGTISTTATPNGLKLSGGGTGPVITATDPAGGSISLSLPVSLPSPTLDGASATYSGIYPGISLTVTAQPTGGFSEVFEVDNAAAETQAQSLKFTAQLSGLTMSQNSDGTLNVADAGTGQTFMTAPSAIMWDSATSGAAANNVPDDFETVTNQGSSAAGPGLSAHTGPLQVTASGSTLSLDGAPGQLDTTAPTYPLYLDPTWTEPFESGGTNNYSEVQSGCPTIANWDDVTQPGVGYNDINGDGNCPGYGAYRSYFDLNTSNLNSSDKIVSSTMKINEVFSAQDSCGEGTQTITVKWTGGISSSTDWNNQPSVLAILPNPTAMKTDGNPDGTMCSGGVVPGNFDLTSAISQNTQSNGSHITFGLFGDESGSWLSLERFNDNPSVYTVYDIPPATPTKTIETPAPVDAGTGSGPGPVDYGCTGSASKPYGYMGLSNIAGNDTVDLSATLTSQVAAAQMYGEFKLTDDTVTGSWSGNSSGYVTSGGIVTWPTPALSDGNLYNWTVTSTDQYYPSSPATSCFFAVDFTPPNNPTVASTVFPALGSSTGTTEHYGQSGSVTFTSTDPAPSSGTASGLKGFYYSLDEPANPSSSHYAQAAGGSASVAIDPTHWGTNTLYVQAVDNAGNLSAETQYSFYLPWNPAAKVTPGDVNGDGIPDLVTTTPSGNLVEYPGNSDTTAAPVTLSTAAQSPYNASPWTAYQFSHNGSFTQGGTDDLWVLNTSNHQLYLYKNGGGSTNNFNTTANVTGPITKAEVTTDEYNTSPAGDSSETTACFPTATFPNACNSGVYDNTDWDETSQLIASPDLYANTTTPSLDSHMPGLLTVENGNLWYYQGQGSLNYIGTAIQLGSGGWNGYTVMSPVTVDGNLVLWARNNTTGAISQYTVDYDPAGYPYLSSPTQLTIPGSANLTQASYPQIYAQVLHATTSASTTYPDLVVQNTAGQVTDYPGAAPNANLPTFAAPQQLGAPSDALTAAYQDPSDNLHTYTSGGTTSPALTVPPGSSPSTVALPTGGYATAFRTTGTNDLEIYNSATGNVTNTNQIIHGGTSPSIAVSAAGVIQVAFQANDLSLQIYNASTGATINTKQGMASGTSPSLAATPAGEFKALFQANTTDLYLYDVNGGTTTATTKGMQPGTSPAIAADDYGNFSAVFQANTSDLWTYDPDTGAATATTKGMTSTSSPAIAANVTGSFEIAFEANTGDLFGWDYNLDTASYYGTTIAMGSTSSPSLAAEPDGTFRVAIQNAAGNLYIYNPTTSSGTDSGQAMNTTTSPSLTD